MAYVAIVSMVVVSGITSVDAHAQAAPAEPPLNSVHEIRSELRACWSPPTIRTPAQVTVRLSLKHNGEILGRPLVSYEGSDTSQDERAALRAAVADALARCAPFRISDALGGIIAGHPVTVKLGEGWKRKGARNGYN